MPLIALLGGIRATVFAALALLALTVVGVQSWRLDTAQRDLARQDVKTLQADVRAARAVRAEDRTRAEAVNHISAAYEKGKTDAQAAGDRVTADLRAGAVRLSRLWRGCEARAAGLSAPAGDPGEPDATDGLRYASAGRIVGLVAACQAQRDALIDVLEAERK